jgi:hypothetical protein
MNHKGKVRITHKQGTHRQVGHGGVAADARHEDLEPLAGRQERSGTARNHPARQRRPQVDGERVRRLGRKLQHSLLTHPLRPGPALLSGLEHDPDCALEGVLHRLEDRHGAQQHGGVPVVTARVHDPVAPTFEFVNALGPLVNGERVHVGP